MLDTRVDLIDSRPGFADAGKFNNIRPIECTAPALIVDTAPPGSYYLVMTHDHALDFEICTRVLQRHDAAYCGLIGSRSKRRRFEKRFRALGLSESEIFGLTCPIGIDEISGKKPAEIAIAVAAQLLQLHERRAVADVETGMMRDAVAIPGNSEGGRA
jgi:xanthine dehydrogenase accessory factor